MNRTWRVWCGTALLTLPWLISPQLAPSPAVIPWLATLACMGSLMLIAAQEPGALMAGDAARAWRWSLMLAATANAIVACTQWLGTEAVIGLLRQRNQLGTLMCLGIAAVLWSVPGSPAPGMHISGWTIRAQRLAACMVTSALAAVDAMTASRIGGLAFLLTVAVGAGGTRARRSMLWPVGLAALGGYALVTLSLFVSGSAGGADAGLMGRFSEQLPSCVGRTSLWSNVVELIAQRPWTGWGWGELDYAHFVADYHGARNCELIDNAHNLFLQLAVELGLPVAFVATGLTLWWVKRRAPWREVKPPLQLAWLVILLIALHSMVEYPLWYGPFALALLLAVLQVERPAVNRRMLQGVACAVYVAVVYAAWDYVRVSQIYLEPGQRLPAYREQTLEKIQNSWLFRDQVRFAYVEVTPLTPDSAPQISEAAKALLHYSPESRVVEKLVDALRLQGHNDEALYWEQKYRRAYPAAYENWRARKAR